MNLTRLHRRLIGMMALAALGALAAGADITPWMLATASILAVRLHWDIDFQLAPVIEAATKALAVGLFLWVLYVGLIVGGDVLPASLAMLFALLVGEMLRASDAMNDFRLYALTFAVLIAATAYYPGVAFAIAFAAYVVLTTLALMVGHLRRQAEQFRIAQLPIGRSFLWATAALSAVTLIASVILFIAFPRLPQSWFGQGRTPDGSMAGFADEVSLGEHGGRLQPNPKVMFRVDLPDDHRSDLSELYWRGLSFDHFDGTRWSRSPGGWSGLTFFPPYPYQARWGGPTTEYRIFGGPDGVRVLFGQHPVLAVRPQSAIRPRFRRNGDLVYEGSDAPVYAIRSGPARPPEERLRAASAGPAPNGERYLQLPRLDPRIAALADSLTRGQKSRYDRANEVERWLREEFRYSLDLPPSSREATLEHFLFERRAGHCEYFSTAMAVLLRSAGIPTRNVNGFLAGEWNERGGYLAVTGNDAHSWVEVWFPELGWVPFDPTPAADREEVLVAAGESAVWPMLFWLDGVQFQWQHWVLAFNLGTQLDLARSIADRFTTPDPGELRVTRLPWRVALLWLCGGVAGAGLLWLATRRRRVSRRAETRFYLAMRRSYARAGYPVRESDTPRALLDGLRDAGAPGVEAREWIVGRYLRARFADEELDGEDRARMRAQLSRLDAALRG